MNVLLINDYLECGGAETVFREQFEILQNDFHVEMFYAFRNVSDKKVSPLSYIYSFHFKRQLMAVLNSRSFDCIVVHNYNSALSPSILDALYQYKKRSRCKIIHYAHDYHLVCPNRGYSYFSKGKRFNFIKPPTLCEILAKRMDEKGAGYSLLKKLQWIVAYTLGNKQKAFDLILAPSDFLAHQLKLRYAGMEIQKMYNVCNSLSIDKPPVSKDKHTSIRLVYFGRLDPVKGLVNFIEAIQDADIDYFFTIIGEGEDFTVIRDLIERRSLHDKIALRQRQNQTNLYAGLSQHDVFVLPSLWYENAPLSIVEAASLGLGLFLSNHGGVLEIGKICNAVHFFNPFDQQDIVSKLEILYKDFLAGDLPQADRNRLQDLFSKESYIENLKRHLQP